MNFQCTQIEPVEPSNTQTKVYHTIKTQTYWIASLVVAIDIPFGCMSGSSENGVLETGLILFDLNRLKPSDFPFGIEMVEEQTRDFLCDLLGVEKTTDGQRDAVRFFLAKTNQTKDTGERLQKLFVGVDGLGELHGRATVVCLRQVERLTPKVGRPPFKTRLWRAHAQGAGEELRHEDRVLDLDVDTVVDRHSGFFRPHALLSYKVGQLSTGEVTQ